MSSSLKLSPLNLNILQPKKLNLNNILSNNNSNSLSLKSEINVVGNFHPSSNNNGDDNNKERILESTSLTSTPSLQRLPSLLSPRGNGFSTLLALSLASSSPSSGTTTSSSSIFSTTTPAKVTSGTKRGVHTMAKRNARERNRVKLVNQGFQTLRQHIPDKFRLKKMSKVDTLRCALDYIRSLAHVLDISSCSDNNSNNESSSYNLAEDEISINNTSDETDISMEDEYQLTQVHLNSICNKRGGNMSHDNVTKQLVLEDNNSSSSLQTILNPSGHSHAQHLLFKNKLSHPGSSFQYINSNNNNNNVESENKQDNGVLLNSPSSSSTNCLNQSPIVTRVFNNSNNESVNNIGALMINERRIKKENEEYIIGLSSHEDLNSSNVNFIQHQCSSQTINSSSSCPIIVYDNNSSESTISVDENYNGIVEDEQNFNNALMRHSSNM